VIVDMGTSINFDVISKTPNAWRPIAVGIGIAIAALFTKTARLRWWISPAQGRHGHQHRGQHAERPLLRRHRHDRWHPEYILAKLGPETKAIATGERAHLIVEGRA
jgi:hypothetical protein